MSLHQARLSCEHNVQQAMRTRQNGPSKPHCRCKRWLFSQKTSRPFRNIDGRTAAWHAVGQRCQRGRCRNSFPSEARALIPFARRMHRYRAFSISGCGSTLHDCIRQACLLPAARGSKHSGCNRCQPDISPRNGQQDVRSGRYLAWQRVVFPRNVSNTFQCWNGQQNVGESAFTTASPADERRSHQRESRCLESADNNMDLDGASLLQGTPVHAMLFLGCLSTY